MNSLLPQCRRVKFCFCNVLTYFWTKFCRVPSWIRCWKVWFSARSKIYWYHFIAWFESSGLMISVSAFICAELMQTKCVLIILFHCQTGIWIILFLNVCRVEYNTSLQGSHLNWFSQFFRFFSFALLIKITWFDVFFLKVFSKLCPIVFSSNSLKMPLGFAINLKKFFAETFLLETLWKYQYWLMFIGVILND